MSKKVLKLAITTVLIIAALCVGYGWWQNRNSIKKGMAQAMKEANKRLRTKSGKLRRGKTQADVARLAHKIRRQKYA